jgi:hypothetical protein
MTQYEWLVLQDGRIYGFNSFKMIYAPEDARIFRLEPHDDGKWVELTAEEVRSKVKELGT